MVHPINFPDIDDLTDVSPVDFLGAFIIANPDLSAKDLRTYNLMCKFTRMRVLVMGESPNPDIGARHIECLKRNASPERASMCLLLVKDKGNMAVSKAIKPDGETTDAEAQSSAKKQNVRALTKQLAAVDSSSRHPTREGYPPRISDAMKKGIVMALEDCVARGICKKFSSDKAKERAANVILEEITERTITSIGGRIPRNQFESLHASFLNLSTLILQQSGQQPASKTQTGESDHAVHTEYGKLPVNPSSQQAPNLDKAGPVGKQPGNRHEEAETSHETQHHAALQPHDQQRSERKITLHFTNQALITHFFIMSIRDISLQIRRFRPIYPSSPPGGNWVVEVNQLENGDLEVFTGTAKDRGRLAHHMNCTYLGNTTNGVEKESGTNLSRAFVSGTGPQIDEEEEEEDADDYPIGKYDPFPLTRRDSSFDRLNTLFFPCGTQAPAPHSRHSIFEKA
ncbi:hypothetical protein OEA41_004262 [Lepraria neglecta]|uniref:Uncharacterized protein n=1 Tax=Lepraria neglecta TaxID=209136 RepID=A0AAE0DFL4_9LECA|nr:hypothetical protein OEA41_004262 [Lepraria neglecta]